MNIRVIFLLVIVFFLTACHNNEDAKNIIGNTIEAIDCVETVKYNQLLVRGNTQQPALNKTNQRHFVYSRLEKDSITGAKAHIYFLDDATVFHEDIYDGQKLIRKHNEDSTARIYDLVQFPGLKKQHFWGKTTPWVIQYMLRYALNNREYYKYQIGQDTMINAKECYTVKTILDGMALMPGFNTFIKDANRVETMILYVDKNTFYPQTMRLETYFKHEPQVHYFTDHRFTDIVLNPDLREMFFSVSDSLLKGYDVTMVEPK